MNESHYRNLSAGFFLIGLGALFLLRLGIWPWILAVIGLAGLPMAMATKRGWLGYQGAFWMIGLAVLFWSGHFWPGILILVGLSVLLGGMSWGSRSAQKDQAEPSKEAGEPFDVDEPLFEDPAQEQERRAGGDTRPL